MRNANGYTYIKRDGKWVPKQYIVAEEKLGRPVADDELVRFADGNRENFDLRNIVVIPKRFSPKAKVAQLQARIDDLIAQRDAIIAQYGLEDAIA